jgi:hypothetical protein
MNVNVIHSQFLVHWTGKDFHQPGTDLDDAIRQHYIDRLADVIEHGFYMKSGTEKIYGANSTSIQARISRTCFSEIKLTQAHRHSLQYGGLGIGVYRDFALERRGNPVFYVQNGENSAVVESLANVHGVFEAGTDSLSELEVILAYVKNVSDKDSTDFLYYDELEWRIVHLDDLEGDYFTEINRKNGIFRINIEPNDIKLIVFPDEVTKKQAISDGRLKGLVDAAPMFVTLDDCRYF